MGLLDDLRTQSKEQRASEEEDAQRDADREKFYEEHIKSRMLKAYKFFTELTEHLNYLAEKTTHDYPLLGDGSPHTLTQTGYSVVIDSSTELKQLDIRFEAELEKPLQYEVFGKDAVLRQEDRLQRYSFKHDCKYRKDKNQNIESAKFLLTGPMPLRVSFTADLVNQTITMSMRNFIDPGISRYNLKPDQLDVKFMDRLGKYILRQEKYLFGSGEMSDDAKRQIREKLEADRLARDLEMKEIEEQAAREEEEAKSQTPKEQLKRTGEQLKQTISDKVTENKHKLKTLFNKLKKQAGFDKSE